MTFIEKLDYLMKINGLNKKKLSEQIGMPYSTIDALYKIGYSNIKLSNFRKICDFFGVTMDCMARDEIAEIEYVETAKNNFVLSPDESKLLAAYRSSDALDKELALRALNQSTNRNSKNVTEKIS